MHCNIFQRLQIALALSILYTGWCNFVALWKKKIILARLTKLCGRSEEVTKPVERKQT